jgi:two-component system chemotaxis response regulator CheB
VKVADQGTRLELNKIYIAVGHKNIKLKRDTNGQLKVRYTSKLYTAYNQPSVDSVMLSAAEILGNKALGVVLSGMGRDGLEGLSAIHAQGGRTIAQSEKTCVVYGMPRMVIEANVADYTVDINEMGSFILGCLD